MGVDCVRYIEVREEVIQGVISNVSELKKIGKLEVGDVLLAYEGKNRYWQISSVNDDGTLNYEPYPEAETLEDLKTWKMPDVVARVTYEHELPTKNVELHEGDVYKKWDWSAGHIFYRYTAGEWIEIEKPEYRWVPVLAKNKKYSFVTSGNYYWCIKYVGARYEEGVYSHRALPDNVSECILNDIVEQWGITWCTLSEISSCSDVEREKYTLSISNDQIHSKLDKILEKLDIKFENDYLDDEDDDPFWDMISVNDEALKVKIFVEAVYGHIVSDTDVRIIYAFNN